ncbi:MAG: HIT domain protein [candidate division BRC1 bacterium ADurb.BinA292]|nr:MAG: HIT domain protein [candidate division BRC1 bacterium ADurb.BinA292]
MTKPPSHPSPSAATLQVQAQYDTDCQYCRLMRDGTGPLERWLMPLVETETSIIYLHRDQFWPGRCVVALREHATELFQLDPAVRGRHVEEMIQTARAIDAAFHPDKLNYECLGNLVEHIHWHLIPRYTWDFLWRRTPWDEPHEPRLLSAAEYAARADAIRRQLTL